MKNQILRICLIESCCLMLAAQLSAQTFTTVRSFSGSDVAGTQAGVVLSGETLYGTSLQGGSFNGGGVYAIKTDGTGFTNLCQFTSVDMGYGPYNSTPGTNSSGAFPRAGLVLSGNTLYGITRYGGSFGYGAIFRVNTDGTGFTNLHSLKLTEGSQARAGLVLASNTLYGAGQGGGDFGRGTLFAVNTDGTGFTNLHHFNQLDGESPSGTLVSSGGLVYGTTYSAGQVNGVSSSGTIFKINADGTGFTNLHYFIAGSDGGAPFAGVILSGSVLYGVTTYGGINGSGTVFKMNTDGTGFTTLHRFQGSDGANPKASLLLRGDTLFGSTANGGSNGNGTIFAVQTDGSGFTNLYIFAFGGSLGNGTNIGGATPYCDLLLSGNTLYGTAQWGGAVGAGTLFSISLPIPRLKIVSSDMNVVLTWPANSPGFSLESSTTSEPEDWSPVLSGSTVINGQHTVTNAASGLRNFFRLRL